MSEERDFVNGMIVKKPNSNAPDWVKAKVSIKLDDFKGWIGGFVKDNPDDEWINIDIKEALWVAPTKGGVFTTEERAFLKSDEFAQARKEAA